MPRAPKSKARQPRERRGDSNAKIQIDSTLGKRILAEVDAAREKYAGRPGDPIFEVGILRIMLADPSRFLLKEVDSDDYRYRRLLLNKLLLKPFMEGAEELAKTVEALKKLDQRSDELLAWEACIFMVFDVLVERARERQQPLPLKQQSQKA